MPLIETRYGNKRINLKPGARQPLSIEFSVVADRTGPFDHTARLSRFAQFEYSVDDIGGGSGGTELVLQGHLKLRNQTVSVECRMQAEFYWLSQAKWCLKWLRTLKLVEVTDVK